MSKERTILAEDGQRVYSLSLSFEIEKDIYIIYIEE
jgi:hypothetical protein